MSFIKLLSKIHIVRVTDANKDYEGSITLGRDIASAGGLTKYDMVHVNCKDTGKHWETYVLIGNDGEVCLNGAAAHHFNVGDEVHILNYGITSDKHNDAVIVYCDENNKPL